MIVDVTDLTPLRRQDHETQKAYEARVARVEKQRVSHMRKLGLRPDLPNGYDLTEKQRARARGMLPIVLYEAWIAHRIVSKRVTKTGNHICAPDPCIKDLIDAYQSVLDGRVPSR